jgi:hypothetical protein
MSFIELKTDVSIELYFKTCAMYEILIATECFIGFKYAAAQWTYLLHFYPLSSFPAQ